jgi:hypothetical protein
MPEIIGSIGVQIVGDYSSLGNTINQAQAAAQAGGSAIANSFNAGVNPAVKTATGLVNQYGQAIQSTIAPTVQAATATNAAASATVKLAAAHGQAVSQIQATSGALRVLEGSGGIRAAERFLASTVGLGPALQAIFPIVGALAFAEILSRVGSKIYEVYTAARDAKEKIGGAFLDLNLTLDGTNDELVLTGDRLDNTLARLNSRPGDQLKTGIHEAVVEADKLRTALNGAIDAAYKLSTENIAGPLSAALQAAGASISGFFKGFGQGGLLGGILGGAAGSTQTFVSRSAQQDSAHILGGNTGQGGLKGDENKAYAELLPNLRAATTEQQKLDAQKAISVRIQGLYNNAIQAQQELLKRPGLDDAAKETVQGNIANLQRQNAERELKGQDDVKQRQVETLEASRQYAQEKASLALDGLKTQEAALTQQSAAEKAAATNSIALAKLNRDAESDAISDKHERAIAEAQEEVSTAQQTATQLEAISQRTLAARIPQIQQSGNLGAAGKSPDDAAKAHIAAERDIQAARAETAAQAVELDAKVAESKAHLEGVIASEARKEAEETKAFLDEQERKYAEYFAQVNEVNKRIAESNARGEAGVTSAGFERQKIELQAEYASQVFTTAAQEIAQQQTLLNLDKQARDAKLAGLRAEQAAAAAGTSDRDAAQAAQLKAEADVLAAQNSNLDLQAQTKIEGLLQQQTFQYQAQAALKGALNQVPGDLGQGVAAGVFNQGKHGEDVGKQITDALRNTGKQLFGDILTAAIKQLVAAIAANTGVQTILHALGLTQTTSTATNTASNVANTAATAANNAFLVTATAAMAALAGSIDLNTVAVNLNTFVPKPFGFAGGGDPPVGVASIVGENGPEMFIPRESGTIIPAGKFGAFAAALGIPSISGVAASGSSNVGEMHFHAHGMTNPTQFVREVARQIPAFLKSTGPQFSPLSR